MPALFCIPNPFNSCSDFLLTIRDSHVFLVKMICCSLDAKFLRRLRSPSRSASNIRLVRCMIRRAVHAAASTSALATSFGSARNRAIICLRVCLRCVRDFFSRNKFNPPQLWQPGNGRGSILSRLSLRSLLQLRADFLVLVDRHFRAVSEAVSRQQLLHLVIGPASLFADRVHTFALGVADDPGRAALLRRRLRSRLIEASHFLGWGGLIPGKRDNPREDGPEGLGPGTSLRH